MPLLVALEALDLPPLVPELLPRGVGSRLGEARRKRAVPTAGSSTAVPPWGPLSLCPGSERRTARGTDRLFRVRGELLDLLNGGLHPGVHVQLPVRAEELISSEIVRDCRVSLATSPTHEPRAPSDKKLQPPPGSRDATAACPQNPTPLCQNAMGKNWGRGKTSLSSAGIQPGGCYHCLGPQRTEAQAPSLSSDWLHEPRKTGSFCQLLRTS